jgi:two-component system sensor histidine kinase YesM
MKKEKSNNKVINWIRTRIHKFNSLSLSSKLILAYITIIAIPLFSFAMIAFKNLENNAKEDLISKNTYQLELETVNINRNIEAMERVAQMAISNKELVEYVRSRTELDVEDLVEFNENTYKEVLQLQYNNPSISDVNIFTDNKNVKEIWPLIFSENRVKTKDWYNKVLEQKSKVLWEFNVVHDEIYDKGWASQRRWDKVVSVSRTLSSSSISHVGIIRVNMLAKDFFSKMYNDVENPDGQIYIIDNNNEIYTNDSSNFIKQENLDTEYLKKEFAKNMTLNNKSFTLNNNNRQILVTYKKIENLNCYMLSVYSIEQMLQYTSEIRNIFLLGTIVLITILSIVTYFITGIILKRLYIIIQSMKKIEKGNFNIEIPVRSNDEIGELAHHFRKMISKINELIAEAVKKRSATKEAELRALQTQIDSHFIYNVLENIKMMAEIEGQLLISDSLASLGSMMRYNMNWNNEYVILNDEINHIENYISLMNIRFDNAICLKQDIEEGLLEHEVLKMVLQPVVENSVKHGGLNLMEKNIGYLYIKARTEGNHIKIEISDNGVGISEEQVATLNKKIQVTQKQMIMNGLHEQINYTKKSTGIGLKNVNERIKLFYGDEYGIEIMSKEGFYTKVIMRLPN